MRPFPIFMKIKNKKCLVVGGGSIAARKITMLLKADAKIIIMAEKLNKKLVNLVATNDIEWIAKSFSPEQLNNIVLVIAATDDEETNTHVSEWANKESIPVNVVDNPSLCSFFMPAVVDRFPLLIAISTSGQSPIVTRYLKNWLDILLPSFWGDLSVLLFRYRPRIKSLLPSVVQRRRFWEKILSPTLISLVEKKEFSDAQKKIEKEINDLNDYNSGEVYLVGAGPGDPELLTIKALKIMQKADIIIYDQLVSDEILQLTRLEATKILVGKRKNNHSFSQDQINQLLVDEAKKGHRVVRLKGGDPLIFGRGGEEIAFLEQNNIDFQIIPGITATLGCAAYSGIPLTHRDHAQTLTLVTAHHCKSNLDWKKLVLPRGTLVFYMGASKVQQISANLIKNGMDRSTPVAIIYNGTRVDQQVIIGQLDEIHKKISYDTLAPGIIIIGEVVLARTPWLNSFARQELMPHFMLQKDLVF